MPHFGSCLCLWVPDAEKASCWMLGGVWATPWRGSWIRSPLRSLPSLSVIVQSAPEPPEDGLQPEQGTGWQQEGVQRSQSDLQVWQLKISHGNTSRADLVHCSYCSRSSQLGFGGREAVVLPKPWGEGAPTKDLPQRGEQNLCNYFLFYCQETNHSHSSHWIVSSRFIECVCCTCGCIFISNVGMFVFFEHFWDVSAGKIAFS